jgi:iron complex transport system ATP-binding protein
MNSSLVTASNLTLSLGDKLLCENLNFTIEHNQSWALLGRNGAGKTTLLHSLMGIQATNAGSVVLNGEDINQIPRRKLALMIGMLFQDGMGSLPATVMETVMLGRHPHSTSLLSDSASDKEVAAQALQAFDLAHCAQRRIESLSGGEQQRLALAMLYTQRPELYLLDEPNNHLDVAFQVRLLSKFRDLVSNDNASLLMATHDINLAARFCDHVVLMLNSGRHLVGTTEEILTEDNLSAAFECQVRKVKEGQMTLFYPE